MSDQTLLLAAQPCPDVEDPAYGNVIITGTIPGSKVYYLCNEGYKTYGAQWRTCQLNGQWSGIETLCIRKTSKLIIILNTAVGS